MESSVNRLHWLDLLVIAMYYTASIAIGIWTVCKSKNSIESFFLANRSITWWPIGLSLFASNIGSVTFVGIAGTAAASGLAVIMFEWNSVFLLIMLAWLFLPVYISSGIYTIPEYLHHRYGGQRLRIYLSIIALITYIFAISATDIYSGAIFIQETLGLNIYIGVAIILGTTVVVTTFGGLLTVVYTDALAVVVMVSGGIVLFVLGLIKIGSLSELQKQYMASIPNITHPNTSCGYPRDDSWHIFRDSWNADFPGVGTFLRTSIMGSLWYWCCNQIFVQRSLAAKNISHAKAGSILAGYLKLTPLITMVLPGMMSRVLFPNEVGCATPEICQEVCGNPTGCTNIAYPRLAVELLPNGLRGLLLAAMIAAVISSLTSVFNSASSIVSMDLWRRFRNNATDRELLIVGKVFLVMLAGISVIWIPVMENAEGGQIFKYCVAANGLFGGPTCALFVLGIFCRRVNECGAFWGLMVGQAWGLLRFILDAMYPVPSCFEEDTRPIIVRGWHVYYHICSQVIVTALVSLIISLFTKPPPKERLRGTTFWTRYQIYSGVDKPNGIGTVSDFKEFVFLKHKGIEKLNEKQINNCNDKGMVTLNDKKETKTINDISLHSEGNSELGHVLSACCRGNTDQLEHIEFLENDHDINIESIKQRMDSLKQSTCSTLVLNINAGIVISLTIGLYIYFR